MRMNLNSIEALFASLQMIININSKGEGWVKSSWVNAFLTARPPFCAQPRNEKFFSGRF